jgi:hypothetical protein
MDHENLTVPETGETRIHTSIITWDPPLTCDFSITVQSMTAREAAEAMPKALQRFRYPPRPHWIKAKRWTLEEAAWLAVGIDPSLAARDLMHRGALDALRPLIAVIKEELASLTEPTGAPQDYLAAYRTLDLPATAFTQEAPAAAPPACQDPAPPKAHQGQAPTAEVNPRDLELVVEVRPGRIIVTNRVTQTITTYGREDLLGKAEKGWALLCLFARYFNALPAKLPDQSNGWNSPSNRRHLGDALKRKLALKETPVIKQNPSSLAFASLRAEYEGIDAMDRQTVALDALDRRPAAYDDEDDPAAAWLKDHDRDYPHDD